jgi:hypothetical protein
MDVRLAVFGYSFVERWSWSDRGHSEKVRMIHTSPELVLCLDAMIGFVQVHTTRSRMSSGQLKVVVGRAGGGLFLDADAALHLGHRHTRNSVA